MGKSLCRNQSIAGKKNAKSKTYKPKYGMLWLRIKFQNKTRCSLLFNGMGCLCVLYKDVCKLSANGAKQMD